MRIRLQTAEEGRTNAAFLLGGIFLFLVALIGTTFVPDQLVPRCHWKTFTGYPCGGCGIFRGLEKLSQLDLIGALRSQPLIIGIFFLLTIYAIIDTLALATRLPRLTISGWTKQDRSIAFALFLLLFIANWVFLIFDGR